MRSIITGANGDIGYAILQHFLASNYYVTAIDKNCNKLRDKVHTTSDLRIIERDLSNDYSIKVATDLTRPFDVLVHCAGIREITPFVQLSLADWQNIQTVNLTSAFIISQHITKLAIQYNRPLCIIYISSISGLYGEPERGAYCASKHGLIGLAKSQAIELAPHSIRVNVIAPGIIESEMTRAYKNNPKTLSLLNKNIPLKRWGTPQHIVQTADMIIKNDYLTGSTIVVDGGWCAGKQL